MGIATAAAKANGRDPAVHSPVAFFHNGVPTPAASNDSLVDREDGWMKKVIEGAEQKRQFSISTIGLIVAIALAVWNIGGSLFTAVRGDTKQEMEIQQLRESMRAATDMQSKTNEKIEKIQIQLNEVLKNKEVQDAKIFGYEAGRADGQKNHK